MSTPILLKNPSVWFVYVPPFNDSPGRWVNLALVTQISEYLSTDGDSISIKILMVDASILIFHGDRAVVILEELEKISGTKSKIGLSCSTL